MSGFLFLLIIDWVMRRTVEGERTGIRWKFTTMLEDLDFADDIALLSSTMKQLQTKTTKLANNATKVGLKLNARKCRVMKANSKSEDKLKIGNNELEEVDSFTYLGANVTNDGGGTADMKKRIALANMQMKKLANIWNANDINRKTKVSLFKSLVLSVLLYGCETWKMTLGEERKLNSFQNKCLRRILKIRWQQHISNERVLELADMRTIGEDVRRRRWNWVGHIMRKARDDDCVVALEWTPEGRRRRGRPKTTWRRMVEGERGAAGWKTWNQVRQAAANRKKWKDDVQALCASWH